MSVVTATEEFPILASLAISPNLQALLEFDDRLRTPSESLERPGAAPVDLTQPTQYPVRRQQEVPTISLPPPRRKKSVVTGVPMTPKTSYECHRAPSPTDTFPGAGEFGGPGEIMFARVEDTLDEMEFGPANPYLNTPPSPPRYFYPRSDDEEDGFDRPSPFYTLEKSRFTRRPIRKRSFGGDQQASLTERKGGRPVSPLYFTTLGCNVGPRPVEKASGPRAGPTRPLLLHSSISSSRSRQTGTSYEPSSSPERRISISSSIHSASSVRSLQLPPSYNPSPVQGSFIDLGSPPMSPSSDSASLEDLTAKPASCRNSPRSSNPPSRSLTPLLKPPIPTTPKPVFSRPHSLRRSVDGRPRVEDPPTTTALSSAERAELAKKTRKLTQMFGQTPGPDLASLSPVVTFSSHLASNLRKGHRVMASVPNPLHPSDKGVWPPPEETVYLNINGRRHSTPLSPVTISTIWGSNEDDSVFDHDQRSFRSDRHSRVRLSRKERSSPSLIVSPVPSHTSFIDLSDDDSSAETQKYVTDHRRQTSFSRESMLYDDTASLSTLTSTQVHEEERRRKREKLVKLHRFLGSRVPADLVLGSDLSLSPPLPSPAFPETEPEDTRKKFRMRKRRSVSLTDYTKPLVTREDRMKSELDMEEKALNVRRAAKMEKVFGVAPPQTLYHTRKSGSPTSQSPMLSVDIQTPPILTPLEQLSFFTMQGFGNKGKKSKRPSTPESSRALISRSEPSSSIEIYNSFRESLNSLTEIVDNDDKVSLKFIHDILHADDDNDDRVTWKTDDDDYDFSEPEIPPTSAPVATSCNERRRSLPLCSSIASLCSEYSVTTPPPEISTFEQKRRRAAKLTNFFGVSHRDIMDDILDSIESGVAEEGGRGTLNQAQVDDLLQKVQTLKTRT